MTQTDSAQIIVPELPAVNSNLVTPAAPVTGRVVSSEICTAKKKAAGWVRHISIDVSGTPLEGGFVAGQSFGVLPPGEDGRGKAHKLRLYSIASPTRGEDGQGKVLATTCKRLIDEHWDTHELFTGVASNYLCDLKPGDEVRVTGPSGKRFLLPKDPAQHDYVFFATGTGIAPFRGMVTDLLEAGVTRSVALVMGSPYASDLIYDRDMRDLADKHDNFRYITALSREPQEEGGSPMYVQERVSRDPLGAATGSLPELLARPTTLVYVCGIAGMELGIFRQLAAALAPAARAGLLEITDDAPADPADWDRKMINRQIKPTKRVFLEVY